MSEALQRLARTLDAHLPGLAAFVAARAVASRVAQWVLPLCAHVLCGFLLSPRRRNGDEGLWLGVVRGARATFCRARAAMGWLALASLLLPTDRPLSMIDFHTCGLRDDARHQGLLAANALIVLALSWQALPSGLAVCALCGVKTRSAAGVAHSLAMLGTIARDTRIARAALFAAVVAFAWHALACHQSSELARAHGSVLALALLALAGAAQLVFSGVLVVLWVLRCASISLASRKLSRPKR
jgi:hypothetical protein